MSIDVFSILPLASTLLLYNDIINQAIEWALLLNNY
jgi:hypothetical protein